MMAEIIDEVTLRNAIESALWSQEHRSQCPISNHKVGACLIAENPVGDVRLFKGCNIEFSTSFNIHAERVALVKAVSEGYRKLLAIVVTSKEKATATMCGYCRQDFLYIQPDIMIYVVNPDGTVGIKESLVDTMKHPYLGRRIIEG